MDCKKIDEQVVRLDKPIDELAEKFVLVRLTKIEGVDLRLFEFDYDLTWIVFFLNADEQIYGRYGGRDAASAESRISLAGLRNAMQAALDAYHSGRLAPRGEGGPASRSAAATLLQGPKLLVENYPAAKTRR